MTLAGLFAVGYVAACLPGRIAEFDELSRQEEALTYEYGWPFAYCTRKEPTRNYGTRYFLFEGNFGSVRTPWLVLPAWAIRDRWTWTSGDCQWNAACLALDALAAAFAIYGFCLLCEWRLRRPVGFWRVTLKGWFVATAVASTLGAVVNYYVVQQREEIKLGFSVGPHILVEGYTGPVWLERIIGLPKTPFVRITTIGLQGGPLARRQKDREILLALRHLRELHYWGEMDGDVCRAVTMLPRMKSLHLCCAERPLWEILRECKLESLMIYYRDLDLADIRRIAQFDTVRCVGLLGQASLTREKLSQIAKMSQLEVLSIEDSDWECGALSELAELESLRVLNCDGCILDDESCDTIAKMKSLRVVRIREARMSAKGRAILFAAGHFHVEETRVVRQSKRRS